MTDRRPAWSALLTMAALAMAGAGPAAPAPKFADGPEAVRDGDRVVVTFAVERATDVTADVVDAQGRAVRRPGRRGPGIKEPRTAVPAQPGTTDRVGRHRRRGKPVPFSPGEFMVRIRLGLRAAFHRTIGWEETPPFGRSGAAGLAVGPDGLLYVRAGGSSYGQHLFRLDRAGKVVPYEKNTVPVPVDGWWNWRSRAFQTADLGAVFCGVKGHSKTFQQGMHVSPNGLLVTSIHEVSSDWAVKHGLAKAEEVSGPEIPGTYILWGRSSGRKKRRRKVPSG